MKKIKKWKTLSSKVILDTNHLKISEDTALLPNGKEKSYIRHTAGQPGSVAIIAVNGKGEVLIQKEYSYPPNKVMWQLPGGSIEPDEKITAAANRELAEESGFIGKKTRRIGYFYTNNRRSDQIQYIVLSTGLTTHKLPENPDEFIENYWMNKKEIKQKIRDGEFDNINLLAALNIWFHLPKGKKAS